MKILEKINSFMFLDVYIVWSGFGLLDNLYKSILKDSKIKNKSMMSNNFISLTHASISSILALTHIVTENSNLYYILRCYSTGYFLYDIIYSIKEQPYPLNIGFTYHHIATILYLYQNPKIYRTDEILFFAELSNIPSYFVYYLLKTNKQSKHLKLMKKIQFIFYSFIRVFLTSYYLYKTMSIKKDKSIVYGIIPLYFMSLHWAKKLWDKL
jgi:hypothetical protein